MESAVVRRLERWKSFTSSVRLRIEADFYGFNRRASSLGNGDGTFPPDQLPTRNNEEPSKCPTKPDKMVGRPLLSICIPAYNRAALLAPLLKSVLCQDFSSFEIVICEDASPERKEIGNVVRRFQEECRATIRYIENEENLGYDRNLRQLIAHSRGEYCLFMGNDDLLCPGALQTISSAISRHEGCGVVVRSYASFDKDPRQPKQIFRYFPDEFSLPCGQQAITVAFRRSVVISGLVIGRDAAAAVASDRFDGTLLYQLYLVGLVLADSGVVFTPEIIALRRDGTPPDFGWSEPERGKFVPGDQTPESSVQFVRGMLCIADFVEEETGLRVASGIRADIGAYSYPILAIQAGRSKRTFFRYGVELGRLGLWRYGLFHAYFAGLLIWGPARMTNMIGWLKRQIGHTPRFGVASRCQRRR